MPAAAAAQLGMDPRGAVAAIGGIMDGLDLLRELGVLLVPPRRAGQVGVKPDFYHRVGVRRWQSCGLQVCGRMSVDLRTNSGS
jgi:hypothetical protein